MGKEIERKFLVADDSFRLMATESHRICQCYLSPNPEATVRLRRKDSKAFITVKGLNHGAVRDEWEYEIPLGDAEEMAQRLAGGWSIEKTRHIVPFGGHIWEVDEFHGSLAPLILAEVELTSPDEATTIPPFISREVTGNPAFYNSTLSHRS